MTSLKSALKALREVLLKARWQDFQDISGLLLGELVGAEFKLARAGDQWGGDGGTGSAAERHLVYEARRYGDNTNFKKREIVGQLDEALEKDPALEAWILITTRAVPEQLHTSLQAFALRRGMCVFTIDWAPADFPKLACLCAMNPTLGAQIVGEQHIDLLRFISSSASHRSTLKEIRRSLQSWIIGFASLRDASHRQIQEIWRSPDQARALFNQDVAGGAADAVHIERLQTSHELDVWHKRSDDPFSLLVGNEGTGKSRAALDWIQSRLPNLPAVVLAPSSSVVGPIAAPDDLVRFIAQRLRCLDAGGERDQQYWERRVWRLLQRPVNEGPALLIYFDGLNEKPSFAWLSAIHQLRGAHFKGKVRLLASTRESFLNERLAGLADFPPSTAKVAVSNFDLAPGAEFDQRLAAAGLDLRELSPTLIELASVPRMFDLVVRLRARLGGVENITVHRLLWEYGADTWIQHAFGHSGWRGLLLDLAGKFRDGQRSLPHRQLQEKSAGAAMPADDIHHRVSTVIDSIFANLNGEGQIDFNQDFVNHSLGLALVKSLEGRSTSDANAELERFLQPIEGYDQRAEIVRAAVSIAIARSNEDSPLVDLGGLCTFWVRTQNLQETHLNELMALAPMLVEPLLEAIERSGGHALSSPRSIAVNALRCVDSQDKQVAKTIAARGFRWYRRVSAGSVGRLGDDGEDSSLGRYRARLGSMIGAVDPGPMTVLGKRIEIVEADDGELRTATAQLLQGRPLVLVVDVMESAALHLAITGEPQQDIFWLNALNTVDPEETATLLRSRANDVAMRHPETGVHPNLNRRVAAILLRQTGYEGDRVKAANIDPRIDFIPSYKDDYLSDPATSLLPLERRHVVQTLRRRDVPLRTRIHRAKQFLVDPSLEIPAEFEVDLSIAARELDFDNMATGMSSTAADWYWRDISLAIARTNANELAFSERKRISHYGGRRGESRRSAAVAAQDSLLSIGEQESKVFQTLRLDTPEASQDDETFVQVMLLIAEIQGKVPVDQAKTILDSGMEGIGSTLAEACASLSSDDLKQLIEEYRNEPRKLLMVASIGSYAELPLDPPSFEVFSNLLQMNPDENQLKFLWIFLGVNATRQLGALLERQHWSWSSGKPPWENEFGSRAIAAVNHETPFFELAERLAPSVILETLSHRDATREDVKLGAQLLHTVIRNLDIELPTTHLKVVHQMPPVEPSLDPHLPSTEIRDAGASINQIEHFLKRLSSPVEYAENFRVLAESYRKKVMDAKRAGAEFFLTYVDPNDFDVVLRLYPEALDTWLEGMDTRSSGFTQRVQLANGFFLPLCETMLARGFTLGIGLWRALRECMKGVNFTVRGDIDRLLNALFLAAPGPDVNRALEEVFAVEETRNDRELVSLVVLARLSNRLEWMRGRLERDAESPCPLHRRRAAFLKPLLFVPEIAEVNAWPMGKLADDAEDTAWKLAQREAFARHWLRVYYSSENLESAHAAWKLFLTSVDRRVWSWFGEVRQDMGYPTNELGQLKERFVRQQWRCIARAIAENEHHWTENYAGERHPKALMPWDG